jgi:hypothetical protein
MTSDWQRWRAGRTQWGEMPPSSVQMAVVHGGRAVARLSCRGVVCNHYQQLESRGMYYRSGWLRRPGAPDESVASAAAPGASRRGDVLAAIVRRRALRGCGQVLVPGAVSDRDRGQSPSRLIAANGRSPALNTGACGLRMVEDSWRHGRYMHLGAGHSNFPCQQRRDARVAPRVQSALRGKCIRGVPSCDRPTPCTRKTPASARVPMQADMAKPQSAS